MIVIFLVIVAAFLALGILAVSLWTSLHRNPRRDEVKRAPSDVWKWIAQAVAEGCVREDGTLPEVTPKQLKGWNLVIADKAVRIAREPDELQLLGHGN